MRAALLDFIEAERGRFFLLLPVAMGAAILGYFALAVEPPLWLGGVGVLAAAAALAACWRHPVARFAAALALAAALGFGRAEWRAAAAAPLLMVPTGPTALTGTVRDIVNLPAGPRLTLGAPSLDGGPTRKRDIQLILRTQEDVSIAPGDSVSAYALLFPPDRPAYPGGFAPDRQAFFANIGADGVALGRVQVTSPAAPNRVGATLAGLRAVISATILRVLPLETGSIAVTLLTGEQRSIPAPERQDFIAAGLAHILAVAGLHVGIVMGLVFGAVRWALTRVERAALALPAKSLAALAALAAGIGYAALTGAHLPILRSLAMASLVTLGILCGRRALSLRGLALAAMGIMLITPEAVVGAGFQMSFSAVLALIAGYAALPAHLRHRRESWRRLPLHIGLLALTSLLAGGASMPFAAYQFLQIQPYWIPANLIAVPLTALYILPLGLLALALMPFGLAWLALLPMGGGIGVIVWLTGEIAAWPAAMLRVPPLPVAVPLCCAGGLIWLCIWRGPARLAGFVVIAAGLALGFATRPPDALISSDAKLIAIRDGNQVWLAEAPAASAYTIAQWRNVWPGIKLVPAVCGGAACGIGPLWLLQATPATCPAGLILASITLDTGCPAPVLDRAYAFEHGATAVWITPRGPRLRTDRGAGGDRPWTAPWPEIDGTN